MNTPTKLDHLKQKEKNLQSKIERIPTTFSKPTQPEALERAKFHLGQIQAEIQKLNKQETTNNDDKKTA